MILIYYLDSIYLCLLLYLMVFGLCQLPYIVDHPYGKKEFRESVNKKKYFHDCKMKFYVCSLLAILKSAENFDQEKKGYLLKNLGETYKTLSEEIYGILTKNSFDVVVSSLENKYYDLCSYTNDNLCDTIGIPFDGFLLREWRKGGCALFSLKALIEYYTNVVKNVREYNAGRWSKLTHFMTPSGIKKVLRENNIQFFDKITLNMSYKDRLSRLKKNLDEGPVFLLVGNGFLDDGKFSLKRALKHRHYITLWGYDRNNFYIYNSNLKNSKNGFMAFNFRSIIESWIIMGGYAIAVKGIKKSGSGDENQNIG